MFGMATDPGLMVIGVGVLAIAASMGSKRATPSYRKRLARLEDKIDLLLTNAGLTYDPLATVPAGVVEALRQGQTAEAIKRYREATGADLAEAKARIDELQGRISD